MKKVENVLLDNVVWLQEFAVGVSKNEMPCSKVEVTWTSAIKQNKCVLYLGIS